MKRRVISSVLSFAMAFALVVQAAPPAQAAVDRKEAFLAYYEFLTDEIDNTGYPIRDLDYYKIYGDSIVRWFSIDGDILGVFLRDLTGDGVEELIYKRSIISLESEYQNYLHTTWTRVYSYVDGELKRIGQTKKYMTRYPNGGIHTWEPEGFIGDFREYFNEQTLYYCQSADGKYYLADVDPDEFREVEREISLYAFDGSVMKRAELFEIIFANDGWMGTIAPINPRWERRINGEKVSPEEYESRVKSSFAGGKEKLTTNDYREAYAVLKEVSQAVSPSPWAQQSIADAKLYGLLPKELKGEYTKPITRREFCLLAAGLYEHITEREITTLANFTDTQDVHVRKLGGVGVINGVGGGKFAPDSNLTRQEAATILTRLSAAMGYPLPEGTVDYADGKEIADWAKTQVGQMAAAGIMSGTGQNCFSPRLSYTREQAVVTLMRLYESVPWHTLQQG